VTAFENSPAIAVRERYHEVVSDQWPVFVEPQPDELLSSWVHRVGFANGIAARSFGRVLGFSGGMWSPSLDMNFQADAVSVLSAHTGVSLPRLSAMTLKGSPLKRLLLPLRDDGRRCGSAWLQFCPQCLTKDAQPYFRRQWRLATRISCPHHRCGLRDRCPSCRSRIAPFDQVALIPQHYCARCGFDLRNASKVPVSPAAQLLDQCIFDICTLEATTGSLGRGSLVRRLLHSPRIGRSDRGSSLANLCASARIRCIERLTTQAGDWLTDDDDIYNSHWRRSILLMGGLAPLIGLLAARLDRRHQRQVRSNHRKRTADLSALLQAYLRVADRRAIGKS